MKDGVIIINTSRGELIDSSAAMEALENIADTTLNNIKEFFSGAFS